MTLGRMLAWLALAVAAIAAAVLPAGSLPSRAGAEPSVAARTTTARPIGLDATISATLAAGDGRFAASLESHSLENRALVARGGGLTSEFSRTAISVRGTEGRLTFGPTLIGRDASLEPIPARAPIGRGNRVLFESPGVQEWFTNGPLGLEQGYVLANRPAGSGPLEVTLGTRGLTPRRTGSTIVFSSGGRRVLEYGALDAIDAGGRHLPARLSLAGTTLVVQVDDRNARYPVTIDPFIREGPALTGDGKDEDFGNAVALSSNGNTALVGSRGNGETTGSAWVFTRTASGWSAGVRLTPTDVTNNADFGTSVALSDDGNTAVVGAFFDNKVGAAWVFGRSSGIFPGSSTWQQEGPKLAPAGLDPNGGFGSTVAVSGDGKTAIVAGQNGPGPGGIWVFVKQTGSVNHAGTMHRSFVPSLITWVQQGPKLTPSDEVGNGKFGQGAALSANGNLAIVSAPLDNGGQGAIWIYSRSGVTWSKTQKLEIANSHALGSAVSLSDDGNTALVGETGLGGTEIGSAVVLSHGTGGWLPSAELTGTGEIGQGQFGERVALSRDGSTALVASIDDNGGTGAAWLFARAGTGWNQVGDKLVPTDGKEFAFDVALSGDGKTALVGALGAGTASVFTTLPAVTSISAMSGPTTGGTSVTITGVDLANATGVDFGSKPATLFKIDSPTQIRAVSPPGAAGPVDVTVTIFGGRSATSPDDRFTYAAPAPTTSTTTTTTTTTTSTTSTTSTSTRTTTTKGTVDHTAPRLTGLTIAPPNFEVGKHAASIVLRLSENARIELSVRRCLKQSTGRHKVCLRFGAAIGFTAHGRKGVDTIVFTGRVAGTGLQPARYRLTVTAVDAAGNRSKAKRASFRIIP